MMFHKAVYWSAVTFATIGYGDYSPSTLETQFMLMVMLAFMFVVLPYLTNDLLSAMADSNIYQRRSYHKVGCHFVICGASYNKSPEEFNEQVSDNSLLMHSMK